jgi:hypothetical protein
MSLLAYDWFKTSHSEVATGQEVFEETLKKRLHRSGRVRPEIEHDVESLIEDGEIVPVEAHA